MSNKVFPSTQEYLNVATVRDGLVILKNGKLAQICRASAVNFALKSEQEQNAIIFQYQNFLNSLKFPINVTIQSRHLELNQYLKDLGAQLEQQSNELLRVQIEDYIQFIKRLISVANIMDKRFYLTIPLSPRSSVVPKLSFFQKLLPSSKPAAPRISETEFRSYKQELAERTEVVKSGLGALGVVIEPLNTADTVELLYGLYNPDASLTQSAEEIGELSSPVIMKA